MNCPGARDWLLQAERPSRLEDAPAEVIGHMEQCPKCQRLARSLQDLEQRYRDELTPVTADEARDAFRPRLLGSAPAPRRFRKLSPPRWLLAASMLLAVTGTVWFLMPPQRARGGTDVVERLIDLNLDLSQAQGPEERNRIYAERAPELKAALVKAELRPADRQLGDALLQSSSWMTANADPMAEADHFNNLAKELVEQIDRATSKKDVRRISKLADFYCRVAQRGILTNIERAEEAGVLNFKKPKQLERIILKNDKERTEKLAALLERVPNASRKEIRRALALPRKTPKQKKSPPK